METAERLTGVRDGVMLTANSVAALTFNPQQGHLDDTGATRVVLRPAEAACSAATTTTGTGTTTITTKAMDTTAITVTATTMAMGTTADTTTTLEVGTTAMGITLDSTTTTSEVGTTTGTTTTTSEATTTSVSCWEDTDPLQTPSPNLSSFEYICYKYKVFHINSPIYLVCRR